MRRKCRCSELRGNSNTLMLTIRFIFADKKDGATNLQNASFISH